MATSPLIEVLSDPGVFLKFEPEDVAELVLLHINAEQDAGRSSNGLHALDTLIQRSDLPQGPRSDQVLRVLYEAWNWLESRGLVIRQYNQPAAWHFISRRGREIRTQVDFRQLRWKDALPEDQLHPRLQERVWLNHIRGDFGTAIFQAYKEVEVAVREAAAFPADAHGMPMMRQAWHPATGPLRDPNQPEAEREALMHLFAGAIGYYKNPHSHRQVSIDDARESAEMLMLASHLLRIVDARRHWPSIHSAAAGSGQRSPRSQRKGKSRSQ